MSDYDLNNIFAKILRQELPVTKVYEDEWVLVFPDIAPQAPVHLLFIPKGYYQTAHEFYRQATSQELISFARAVALVVDQENLGAQGYRLIANTGTYGGQEVPHYHLHLLAGETLGPIRSRF